MPLLHRKRCHYWPLLRHAGIPDRFVTTMWSTARGLGSRPVKTQVFAVKSPKTNCVWSLDNWLIHTNVYNSVININSVPNIELGMPRGLAQWRCCAACSSCEINSARTRTAVTNKYSTPSQVLKSHVKKRHTHIFIECCPFLENFQFVVLITTNTCFLLYVETHCCYFLFLVPLYFESHIEMSCPD